MIVKYSTGKIDAVYPDKDKGAKAVPKREQKKDEKKEEKEILEAKKENKPNDSN